MLGLCGCSGFSLVAVRGLLIAVASLVAEHGLQSSGSAVMAHGLSCSVAYGIFQEPGIKPCFLHWKHWATRESERCCCVWLFETHGPYSPWSSPGHNTGVGSLSLLQGIFPTRGANPGLPHCRQILCQLSHKGSPKILKWVVYHFSGDLPNPGIEPGSLELQVNSLTTELSGKQGLMLKLNRQYFWYLMQRANSLEKTLILGKIEVRRRRGW